MNDTETQSQHDKDRAEIIAVIEDDAVAWFKGDIEAWKACWVQDKHTQHQTARITSGARLIRGFDALEAHFTPVFRDLATQGWQADTIRREDWRFSIGTDMAWVTFDQIAPSPGLARGRHNILKILEKVAGAWKIAATFQIPNRIGYYQNPWVQVDRNGRIIDMSPGAEDAFGSHGSLKLVGHRLCAHNALDDAKLREALAEADNFVRLLKRRAPVALVLEGVEDDAISLCWVTIADMMIVVLIGDERLLTNSIAAAGKVYQLSAAQMRVAEAIARGNDLSITAASLGVQPSTVRTHVRRMFERINVSSQPALIRALLSIEAPYD